MIYDAGTITLDKPLVIDHEHGTRHIGAGMSHYASWQKSGWHAASKPTRIVYTGPAGTPAIILRRALRLYISDLTIERQTPGPLIQLEAVKGWGNGNHAFERVAFIGDGPGVVGVRCGESANDHNCADLVLRDCFGRGLDSLLRVENDQGANYVLDKCGVNHSQTVCDFACGGQVQIRGGATYDVPTVVRTAGGGGNAAGILLDGLRCDGQTLYRGGQTLIDASNAKGSIVATVVGVSVGKGSNGPLFIPPAKHKPGGWQWRLETLGLSTGGHAMEAMQ